LKWFLRWATNKGYNTNTAFLRYEPKLKTTPKKVVFLDWNELMKVFEYEVPDNGAEVVLHDAAGNEYMKTVHDAAAIEKTRDIFCFCCFTSLRYSDAVNLKRVDISGDSLTITTVKTADTITVELNKYAKAILQRYEGRADLGGYVFPHLTNQRMNIYLKDLCELCGINTPITQTYYRGSTRYDETAPKYELMGTHAGRRTFICNALMLGIPAEIVMKWTGHSDYKAMKPYIDVTNAAKAVAMNKFNDL
jgi:integrase